MTEQQVTLEESSTGAAPCHYLKIDPEHFAAVADLTKRAEVRKHDRDFWVNDLLHLREWVDGDYTGRIVVARITHILPGGQYGIEADYSVLSFIVRAVHS